MKTQELDGVQVWKDFEAAANRRDMNVIERALYSYLLLHTRLEGKSRLHFTLPELSRSVRMSRGGVRNTLRLLSGHGALRFIERSYKGYLIEVRLPAQMPGPRLPGTPNAESAAKPSAEPNLEELNIMASRKLRRAIHEREGGKCFYCICRTTRRSRCLDHVVPRANCGQNSYRNVVSCCAQCNWQKKHRPAEDFLRELHREGRLSRNDLARQLRKLQSLAAGNLRPPVFSDKAP